MTCVMLVARGHQNVYIPGTLNNHILMDVWLTITYVKIWNHQIETTIYKWMFAVPGLDKEKMIEMDLRGR